MNITVHTIIIEDKDKNKKSKVYSSSVEQYLSLINEENIVNIPTFKVYEAYKRYCIKYKIDYISHGEFSKQVKKYYGFMIIDKKIDGKKYRIFVKEGENDGKL